MLVNLKNQFVCVSRIQGILEFPDFDFRENLLFQSYAPVVPLLFHLNSKSAKPEILKNSKSRIARISNIKSRIARIS